MRRRLVAAGAAGALLLTVGGVLVVDVATAPEETIQPASARAWIRKLLPNQRRAVVTLRRAAPTRTPVVPVTGPKAGPSPASPSAQSAPGPGQVAIPPLPPAVGPSGPGDFPGLEPPGHTATAPGNATAPAADPAPPAAGPTTAPTTGPSRPTGDPGGTGNTTSPAASTTAGGDRTLPPATLPSSAGDAGAGRRGLWNAIGRTPTPAELDAAPALYGVVVVNIWETAALRRLKQLDPTIVVLAYQDLSSARSYDHGPLPPAGVGWAQANANPSWIALDTSGRRIEWNGYPGHWQTAVWDAGYQQAWTANVVQKVVAGGFDGVLADNAVSTLRWYSDQTLAGTSSAAQTDARLRAGIQALVERAGPALQAEGKMLVPNVSDARLFPGRWAAHARWGGAMEENFAHFGTTGDLSSFVTDWGADGWEGQARLLAHPGLSLAVTPVATGDQRAMRYGYASLLVRGDGDSFWQPNAAAGTYDAQQWIPEQRWRTGSALGAGQRVGGAWVREYDHVWAAVNPTNGTVTVTAPAGATDSSGTSVRTVALGPATGIILRTA